MVDYYELEDQENTIKIGDEKSDTIPKIGESIVYVDSGD
jgi:hypothetical protein